MKDQRAPARGASKSRPLRWLVVTLLLLAASLALSLRSLEPRTQGDEISLDRAHALATTRKVRTAIFFDQDARVLIRTKDAKTLWSATPSAGTQSGTLLRDLVAAGANVRVDQQWGKRLLALFAQFILPLLLLANLFGIFILLARGGSSQVRDLFAFSRIGNKRAGGAGNPLRFADVAAIPEAIGELAEVRDYLAEPARFARMGALPPKGVLLYGPPGCGKTLLARALAGEAGVPFYSLSGSEFVESLVGVGAARVRDLFEQAKLLAPAIVFIDELDAAGRRRGAGIGGGHDEREQTLNELLVQMDGFAPNLGVVVVGATNRPDILDPALLRHGRFDRHVVIEAPDVVGRAEILALHARGRPIDTGVDLESVARATPGFTGADLANVLNEGSLLAVRRNDSKITAEDLVEAVERVQFGPRRRGRLLAPDEVRRLAYHEAGHVLVARAVEFPAEIRRVSIVARGRNAAQCDLLRSDRSLLTRAQLLAELTVTLAGMAAEELEAGDPSTASEADIERATDLARHLAGRYGMSETVGRIRVTQKDTEVFLGRDYLSAHHASPSTLERLDSAVRDLVAEAEERALQILQQRRGALDSLAEALIERETVDASELPTLLSAPAARRRRASRAPA